MQNDIAIVQLSNWGDVIIATAIVKVIKEQWPNRHITFITSSSCCGAVQNNSDIDSLQIIPTITKDECWAIKDATIAAVKTQFKTVIAPWAGFRPRQEWTRLDRDIRPNFMWGVTRYAEELGLIVPFPLKTYLYPTDQEYQRVNQFLQGQGRERPNLLMEIGGESGQTYWNNDWTYAVIDKVLEYHKGEINVWISHGGIEPAPITILKDKWKGRISYLNQYSLREMSILINLAHIMISVSSGTSNACSTHLCKKPAYWFEAVNDPIWDSSPYGEENKLFYYCANSNEFAEQIILKMNIVNNGSNLW